ncbi:MAG: GvpL/GvpF family gas vesicle protein [bacterium]|nr:GvpL/GvpF family gas vesicle protein [bacterium]
MDKNIKEGKYIYCMIQGSKSKSFGHFGIGGRGDELYSICFKDISAVVSNSPITKYPVSRENMISHEKAIEEVMKEHTVLPVRFCTIAEDEEGINKILSKEYDKFKNLLEKFIGKRELGLKAIFKEDIIYGKILEKYQDIRTLKEKLVNLAPEKTYYKQVEIGRMVEEALQKEKEICKDDIFNTLLPLCCDSKVNNTYGELMIINAAFLVDKSKEAEFDLKVQQLDKRYGSEIKFKYVGTLPPFNFINLVIETGSH